MDITGWLSSASHEQLKEPIKALVDSSPFDTKQNIDNKTYFKGAKFDVIFGSWKDYDVGHHKLKRDIVKNSNNFIVIETPLLGRGPVSEVLQDRSYRIGLNGFMANSVYPEVGQERVDELKFKFNIPNEPPETVKGDYILIPLQLPGDASLEGVDISNWVCEKVSEIRKITNRKIVIRSPQLERNFMIESTKQFDDIYFQKGTFDDKQVTLDNAYAVVTYSSGMSVEAILNGNRTFVESPNGFKSPTQPSLEEVLKLDYTNFNSEEDWGNFVKLICSTFWTLDELRLGKFWRYFNV